MVIGMRIQGYGGDAKGGEDAHGLNLPFISAVVEETYFAH